jgi:hypothetical protein
VLPIGWDFGGFWPEWFEEEPFLSEEGVREVPRVVYVEEKKREIVIRL